MLNLDGNASCAEITHMSSYWRYLETVHMRSSSGKVEMCAGKESASLQVQHKKDLQLYDQQSS